jgi:hypothetical protein
MSEFKPVFFIHNDVRYKTAPPVWRGTGGTSGCGGCINRHTSTDVCIASMDAAGVSCHSTKPTDGLIFVEDKDVAEDKPIASIPSAAEIASNGMAWEIYADRRNVAQARITDPDTSHAAAGTVKLSVLEAKVIEALQRDAKEAAIREVAEASGLTGKELASRTGVPLNSITPRLAPLRRKGLIHSCGKYDRQHVWRLGKAPV